MTRTLMTALLALLILVAPQPLVAQGSRAPLIGVIDMQKILRESIAVRSLSKRVEILRSDYQREQQQKESQFRNSDLELARQRAQLSPQEFARQRRDLELRAASMQREALRRKTQIDQLFGQGMSQVQQTLIKISQSIAAERGLDLVLAKATVMLVKPDLEITDVALQQLNEVLPEVAVPELQN